MAYTRIFIDEDNLTLLGVPFPDKETLNKTAHAIGSNMFEGFEPTPRSIEIIRDYVTDKITILELIRLAKEKNYG
jgi:putative transcriptional regulator